MTDKPSNPKDAIGANKIPLHLWPETATVLGSMGLLDGMLKYGRSNYRAIGVRASIYVDACRRHLTAWFEGEDTDPDSGLPHLGHALACLAILTDAQANDKLADDRQYPGGYRKLVEEMTPHVGRLKDLHADKDPKHYTKADAEEEPGSLDALDELIKSGRVYPHEKISQDPLGSVWLGPYQVDLSPEFKKQFLCSEPHGTE